MRNQLALIDPDFRLDEQTKALGRRGVAAARAVLHSVAADDGDAGGGGAGTAGAGGSGGDSARDAAFAAGGRAMAQAERTPAA